MYMLSCIFLVDTSGKASRTKKGGEPLLYCIAHTHTQLETVFWGYCAAAWQLAHIYNQMDQIVVWSVEGVKGGELYKPLLACSEASDVHFGENGIKRHAKLNK